jgi:PKD repeat protein
MMKSFLTLLLCSGILFLSLPLRSQNEAQKWFFGSNAGLDFATNPPTVITNTFFSALEGCAGICNTQGNFLFYTQGLVVYNQTGGVMANGIGLLGGISSTQAAIIIKRPGSNSIYYIFTTTDFGDPDGLRYSVVDLGLAAGLGSVTVQNVMLQTPSTEKLTAVRHCNGVDTWVLSHDYNSSNFRAHLVTAAGVNTTAVISNVGNPVNNFGFGGQMKISPNGRKLGFVGGNSYPVPGPVMLFDFDPATGVVSNPANIGSLLFGYGCEFSPDGTKFYAAEEENSRVVQWDICAGNTQAITSSSLAISTSTYELGALQLAPNGKIYIARRYSSNLSVINFPNLAGAACNFVDAGQSIAPATSEYGLPTFEVSFFKPAPAPFGYTLSCNNISVNSAPASFTNQNCNLVVGTPVNVQWSFGDPASGAANSSTLNNASHSYGTAGSYTVQLTRYFACSTETVAIPVTVSNTATPLSVSGTFTICSGQTRTYSVTGASSYAWSNGSTQATVALSPTTTTVYSVAGTATNSCESNKQFTITVFKCTGIESISGPDNSLYIYPNPSSGMLYIETTLPVKLKILDNNGNLVLEKSFKSGSGAVDISSFSSGIYTVQSFNQQGVKTLRLVKTE